MSRKTQAVVISSIDPVKSPKFIYTVTCLYDIPPYCDESLSKKERKKKMEEYKAHGGRRAFGWFSSLKKAKEAVENNYCDIHECSYKYAIIEKTVEGFHCGLNYYKEYWYQWEGDDWRGSDAGKFVPINKPSELEKIISWGLG